MSVRWGDSISTQFTVANGVKQGGVISPILFNVYMDDRSTALNSSGTGGHLGPACLNMILKSIVIPSAIDCTDVDCKHAGHIRDIDNYYDNICDTLVVVSRKHIPSSTFKCSSDYIVPGFNEHLKDLHEKARQCYLQWKASGRSRSDHTHAEMRVSRPQFKYTLRHCRANETMMRADALANALKNKNSTAFWKDVQR